MQHSYETAPDTPMRSPTVSAAYAYAERGWRVLPLHALTATGICTCLNGAQCKSPAHHPRIKYGLKNATTDQQRIRAWWL